MSPKIQDGRRKHEIMAFFKINGHAFNIHLINGHAFNIQDRAMQISISFRALKML